MGHPETTRCTSKRGAQLNKQLPGVHKPERGALHKFLATAGCINYRLALTRRSGINNCSSRYQDRMRGRHVVLYGRLGRWRGLAEHWRVLYTFGHSDYLRIELETWRKVSITRHRPCRILSQNRRRQKQMLAPKGAEDRGRKTLHNTFLRRHWHAALAFFCKKGRQHNTGVGGFISRLLLGVLLRPITPPAA